MKPDVESTRDEVEKTQQEEHELCERDTEGAGRSANPIDVGVKTPWWREAGETAEFDRCRAWCCVGTTSFLRVDMTGSQCEAFLEKEVSKSFINQEKVDRLQLKALRPSEACMFMEATAEQMRNDRVVMRSTTWGERYRLTG